MPCGPVHFHLFPIGIALTSLWIFLVNLLPAHPSISCLLLNIFPMLVLLSPLSIWTHSLDCSERIDSNSYWFVRGTFLYCLCAFPSIAVWYSSAIFCGCLFYVAGSGALMSDVCSVALFLFSYGNFLYRSISCYEDREPDFHVYSVCLYIMSLGTPQLCHRCTIGDMENMVCACNGHVVSFQLWGEKIQRKFSW